MIFCFFFFYSYMAYFSTYCFNIFNIKPNYNRAIIFYKNTIYSDNSRRFSRNRILRILAIRCNFGYGVIYGGVG